MGFDRSKIAVTGGLGFIGSYLVEELVRTGHDVTVLDHAEPTSGQAHSGAVFVRVDLRDAEDVCRVLGYLAEKGYRSLIHLAGNADALRSISEPDYDFGENALATVNLLTAAAQTHFKRAVIASSALVYGRNGANSRRETELPDPIFPYSASKLAAEAFATALSRWSDLQVVSARLFTVYGPARDPENSPVEPIQYVARAVNGKEITVLGDPDRKIRDFVHIHDVVNGLRILLEKGKGGSAYNIGSGTTTSLRLLLERIGDALGRPVDYRTDMSDLSDSYSIVADIDRISRLGYSPGVTLNEYLTSVLRECRSEDGDTAPIGPVRTAPAPTTELPHASPHASPHALPQAVPAAPELSEEERTRLRDVLTPISSNRAAAVETAQVADALRGARAEIAEHRPARVKQMAVFLPSNVIAYSYALFGIVPSLFADRIDIRPSRIVQDQSQEVHRILGKHAAGDVRMHAMSQPEYLRHTRDADVVVFTGRYDNGVQVARNYPGALFLFFGSGVNPLVVGASADLEKAVDIAIESRMYNSGQDCLCSNALLVHHSRAEEFTDLLVDRVRRLKMGDPTDAGADYTPLYYPGVAAHVAKLLTARKNHVIHRGTATEHDRVVDPAVLRCDITDPYQVHETFAPVFDIRVYQDDDQIEPWLSALSRRELALGATVIGAEPVAARLERRHTVVRDMSLFAADDGNQPFGGYGLKASHVAHRGRTVARPLLVSREVAEAFGRLS